MSEPSGYSFLRNHTQADTYQATAGLRYVNRPFDGKVLQQAWQNLRTAEFDWRDVPTEAV